MMRYDHLLEPVTEAEPCGPDLDEAGDNDYLNYVLSAENRLPLQFFDPATGNPFDRSTIDVKAETKAIAGFLEQSRDLRLLTLEARFQILVGQIEPFADCLTIIAALLRDRWADVNPKGFDGDFTLRQNAVGVIEDRRLVILPLQYATVLRDARLGNITLRDKELADKKATPRENERTLDASEINDALRNEKNRAAVDVTHASLTACAKALSTIQASFAESTDYQFPVTYPLLHEKIGDLLLFIESGRPDLDAKAAMADAAPVDGSGVEEGQAGQDVEGSVRRGSWSPPGRSPRMPRQLRRCSRRKPITAATNRPRPRSCSFIKLGCWSGSRW